MPPEIHASLNTLLAEWNPIRVPDHIAQFEYSDYVPVIINAFYTGKGLTSIREALTEIYTNRIGYDLNSDAEAGIQILSESIFRLLPTPEMLN